jgi:hypothetical protein
MYNINNYLLDMEHVERVFKEDNKFNIGSLDIVIYELKVDIRDIDIMYMPTDMSKPDMHKMYMVKDMKDSGIELKKSILNKYGFNRLEINWLHQHRWLE